MNYYSLHAVTWLEAKCLYIFFQSGVQKLLMYLFLGLMSMDLIIWNSLLYDCLLTDWKTTLKSIYYYRRWIFSSIYSYKSFVCLVSITDDGVYIESYTNDRVTVTMWKNWPPVYELTDVIITDLRNTLLKQKSLIFHFWLKNNHYGTLHRIYYYNICEVIKHRGQNS